MTQEAPRPAAPQPAAPEPAAPQQWIWFRGLVRWKVHWGEFEKEFRKVRPQDTVQMIDFPGFGEFNNLQSPTSMEEMLNHVDSKVQGPGPFHVMAFSLGGMVAAHWSARHSNKVEKLYLINTSDSRSRFYERFQIQNWWLLISRLIHPTAENVEVGILSIISNRPEKRKKYRTLFVEAYKKTPFTRQNLIRQLTLASRTRFSAHAPVPTVFLASKGDRLVNYHCTLRLSEAWKCPVEVHEWAGHDITLDDPEWVLQKIQKHNECPDPF